MMIAELVTLFIDSRKRGIGQNATRKCRPATIRNYEWSMKVFSGWLSEEANPVVTQYESIRRSHLAAFLDWLDSKEKSGEWKKASCLQVLRTLRTFFIWLEKDEDCQLNELKSLRKWLPRIERMPHRMNMPEMADLKKWKNSFTTDSKDGFRNYVATCLMMDTGIRLGEVCNLRVDHVKFEEKTLLVDGKTGPRMVPITLEMARLLKAWLKRRDAYKYAAGSPYVFVSRRNERMSVNGFGTGFRRHSVKLGISDISAHILRHMFCTNYLRKGGDLARLKNITGHATYDMLDTYVHMAKAASKEAQQELEKVSLLKET